MRDFRDSFERYKNGTATEEEAAQIQEEVAKHEAIEEYLAGEIDRMPLPIPDESGVSAGKRISRKVRLKICGMVLLVLAVTALLVAAGMFACNQYFYNPNEGIEPVFGGDGQLLLDLWAFNELHSPEYSTTAAEAWRESPGCYQVRIYQTNILSGKQEISFDRIAYGKVQINGEHAPNEYWRFPLMNAFGYRQGNMIHVDETGKAIPQTGFLLEQTEALTALPDSCQVSVYVTFREDMELQEFAKFYAEWNDRIHFLYNAVLVHDGYTSNTVGFSPAGYGIILQNTPEEYPYFQLTNHDGELEKDPASAWEKHFRDLLHYLIERPGFLEAMTPVNGINNQYYQDILNYIDHNGIKTYGALLNGNVVGIREFLETEQPVDFYVTDVRISVLS